LRALTRAIDHLSQFLGLAAAQFYLLCAVITTYEVVMRYLFNSPTQWAFEMVMVLCASAWVLSVGYVTRHKRHIGITVLYVMAPPRVQWLLELFALVVALVAVAILAYAAWEPALRALTRLERSGSAFNSPQPALLKAMLVIGALLYCAQLTVNLVRHLQAWNAPPPAARAAAEPPVE
jgi:TRAP-type mannitol/chloroaromatic compound transport system permease small subunit